MTQDNHLLTIKDLRTYFYTEKGVVKAIDGIDLKIDRGEILGLVGETGCGKSMTALSILQLVPTPPGRIVSGQIYFKDENLLQKSIAEMKKVMGKQISMIFQDPMSSLNPVFKVGHLMMEPIMLHQGLAKKEAMEKAHELLEMVRISDPERVFHQYPHQLSGGICQRVMIAIALSCNPSLLIADEPTTALDVTIQAAILKILYDLIQETGVSCLFITHNLGVVAKICHRVAIMYAGKIVEVGDVTNIFKNPLHPYTNGLMETIPIISKRKSRLKVIEGTVPDLMQDLQGCHFCPRCQVAKKICGEKKPELIETEKGHFVSCFV